MEIDQFSYSGTTIFGAQVVRFGTEVYPAPLGNVPASRGYEGVAATRIFAYSLSEGMSTYLEAE